MAFFLSAAEALVCDFVVARVNVRLHQDFHFWACKKGRSGPSLAEVTGSPSLQGEEPQLLLQFHSRACLGPSVRSSVLDRLSSSGLAPRCLE